MRTGFRILGVLVLIVGTIFLYGLSEARRDPVVHRITLPLRDWPAGAKPVRAVLLSDIHYGNIVMGQDRLARIVDQVNALHPDLVLITGDFIAGHGSAIARESAPDLAASLSRLRAPLGVVAVLGNHDHDTDAVSVRRTLLAANITTLSNGAVRRGPLAIGGIDDFMTGHDDMPRTVANMRGLSGAKILLTHGPDVARALREPAMAAGTGPLAPLPILAGHTHCGQVVLPRLGPVKTVIDFREVYLCGASRSGPDRLVVTGGVGTSVLPIRIGAPPDLWVITFGPVVRPVSPDRGPASDRDRAGG